MPVIFGKSLITLRELVLVWYSSREKCCRTLHKLYEAHQRVMCLVRQAPTETNEPVKSASSSWLRPSGQLFIGEAQPAIKLPSEGTTLFEYVFHS